MKIKFMDKSFFLYQWRNLFVAVGKMQNKQTVYNMLHIYKHVIIIFFFEGNTIIILVVNF